MLNRQPEASVVCVVLDDASGCHGGQPLTDVPLLQTAALSELSGCRRAGGGQLEQPDTAADLNEAGDQPAGYGLDELGGELLDSRCVDVCLLLPGLFAR